MKKKKGKRGGEAKIPRSSMVVLLGLHLFLMMWEKNKRGFKKKKKKRRKEGVHAGTGVMSAVRPPILMSFSHS